MIPYLSDGVRFYLRDGVDWDTYFAMRKGSDADPQVEREALVEIVDTAAKLCASLEPEMRAGWTQEARLENGEVVYPPHIARGYDALAKAGLVSFGVGEQYGGFGLPVLVTNTILQMIARADAGLMTILGLQAGVADDIQLYASDELKQRYLPGFAKGELMGAMDLTEAQAGSDLGGITTRATERDGKIFLDGEKIFITNGGSAVHLVLARDADSFEASKSTTNGLSLVLVARHREDGSSNGVRVARLEHKLGIHGSATCEVVFDGAIGVRLGKKGHGFRAMLELMNAARLGVAAQALGLCEAALHDATRYAAQREQFGVAIAKQPLVMTMLAKMVVNTEAVRALLYRTYVLLDRNRAREAALARTELSAGERAMLQGDLERDTIQVRLLTPLCKYFATEVCDDLTRDAMQVYGGIGYTMDADVAKLHADSLIMTIYEGTSEIQASFALKEMGKGALTVVFKELRTELASLHADPVRERLSRRVEEVMRGIEEAAKTLFSDPGYALLRAKLLAEMVIDVIASCELLKQAGAAPERVGLAEAFIRRRMLDAEHMERRIQQNAKGRLESDEHLLVQLAAGRL
jgi:alkylation response protein AidB-like acyl-CoA dehydrogenase